MKKLTIILLFLFALLPYATAATLTPRQKQDVITKLNKSTMAMKSMQCGFTQTKYLSLLSDKMVSKGHMYYQQPHKLRWEYSSPYQYTFILNGTEVYVRNKSKKDVINTNNNKLFKEVARIMLRTVTGKALSDAADFSIDVFDGGSLWKVILIPRKKDLKRMFNKIILSFRKSDSIISEIDLYEKNNDRTNIILKDVTANGKINESLFVIPK